MNWTSVNFDWNHTRAFLITAEEGTLSAAAKALNMTQPTLSRQVAALENEMGVTLFERVGQRLVLTDSGIELLEHARTMNKAARSFSLSASGQSQQLEGVVTVSVGELDAVYRLPKIIAKLRKEEPAIDIEVVVTNAASDLKRREADIAIRNFRPTQEDLIAKKLGEEVIWLYATQKYLAQFQMFSDPSKLNNIQIIGFDQSNSIAEILNSKGWQVSKRNCQISTSFQLLQLELCKQELGLIFLPEAIGDENPDLVRAFEHLGPTMQLPVWLVCHKELRTNLRVRRVFDFISNELNQTS
jgi:DNA-binding transcriptional LysR family regulator